MRLILLALLSTLGFTAPSNDDTIARYVDDIYFRYDSNDDNALDKKEARQFFIDANEDASVNEAEYNEWFRLIDGTKDGKLQWAEIYKLAEAAAE